MTREKPSPEESRSGHSQHLEGRSFHTEHQQVSGRSNLLVIVFDLAGAFCSDILVVFLIWQPCGSSTQ